MLVCTHRNSSMRLQQSEMRYLMRTEQTRRSWTNWPTLTLNSWATRTRSKRSDTWWNSKTRTSPWSRWGSGIAPSVLLGSHFVSNPRAWTPSSAPLRWCARVCLQEVLKLRTLSSRQKSDLERLKSQLPGAPRRRFDPSKAFQHDKENRQTETTEPLKEGNHWTVDLLQHLQTDHWSEFKKSSRYFGWKKVKTYSCLNGKTTESKALPCSLNTTPVTKRLRKIFAQLTTKYSNCRGTAALELQHICKQHLIVLQRRLKWQ